MSYMLYKELQEELQNYFAQLGFSLALAPSLVFSVLITPFWNRDVYSTVYRIYVTCFDLYRVSKPKVCLESQVRLWT